MVRCKNLYVNDTINNVEEWFNKCPPQRNEKHWVNGRSAKETAKHWMYAIPPQFKDLLKNLNLTFLICSPEYVSRFDSFGGNGRNHDLLILAENQQKEKTIISIESKVDESFGKNIDEKIKEIDQIKSKGKSTNRDERLENLIKALFTDKNIIQTNLLRYQLLTAVAGTLSEAKKQNSKNAIFIVQTFISQEMNFSSHRTNQRDLDYFIETISTGKFNIIHDGDLLGPIRVPGDVKIPNDVDLWFGKYSIKI